MIEENLLIEIVTEELPPQSQKELGENFGKSIFESLKNQKLINESTFEVYSTPRRLGVKITKVLSEATTEKKLIKLMPKKIGFDVGGNAQQALIKKLESIGEKESSLSEIITKEEILYIEKDITGKKLYEIVEGLIHDCLIKLPIKKVMTYQLEDGWETVNFVRPAKNLVILHGSKLINATVLGIKSSRTTVGHRFESKNKVIELVHANDYADKLLKEGSVIASFEKRKGAIKNSISIATQALKKNVLAINDDSLLEEVTALVEMPNILIGKFESKYLDVPQECLILTMKSNQKYFPIVDNKNKLTNQFIIVSNLTPANPKKIIEGNEKVIRPRLADAEFFFKQDKKNTLLEMSNKLDKIIYHNKLGSQSDRAKRVSKIHRHIYQELSIGDFKDFERVALLAKADLVCLMVGEFPELQGIMGRYYALNSNEDISIADTIEDHYKPKFSGDTLPRSTLGVTFALADKFETLISLFSIDEKPTGVKDPFGLRRNAIGIIRLLIENNLPLNIRQLIEKFMPKTSADKVTNVKNFIDERLINYLKEKSYLSQEIDAVMSSSPVYLHNIIEKIEAIRAFSALEEAQELAAANKRVSNILKKYQVTNNTEIITSLLNEPQEKELYKSLKKQMPIVKRYLGDSNYVDALRGLVELKDPIDNFFDKVMVNDKNIDIKNNRHNLLIQLHEILNCVADISKVSSS
jgi:glycyl-tRNA synthetase beta chain